MAYSFPEELRALLSMSAPSPTDFCQLEREHIGWDHAAIGAHYLARHQISEEIIFAVRYHNSPDLAPRHGMFPAAVQIADHLVRHLGISGGFEKVGTVADDVWLSLPGWQILFGSSGTESGLARASIANSLQKLPSMLQGLV